MDNSKSIDAAIKTCSDNIRRHRISANWTLLMIIVIILIFVAAEVCSLLVKNVIANDIAIATRSLTSYLPYNFDDNSTFDKTKKASTLDEAKQKSKIALDAVNKVVDSFPKIDISINYISYGFFILMFGVFTSFYRFHLKEISKYEHFLFGFERIRIAGNNSTSGYDDEVKTSLTKDAFLYEIRPLLGKDKKIESPIEGHPTSDIATTILNKLVDAIDIVVKPKKDTN